MRPLPNDHTSPQMISIYARSRAPLWILLLLSSKCTHSPCSVELDCFMPSFSFIQSWSSYRYELTFGTPYYIPFSLKNALIWECFENDLRQFLKKKKYFFIQGFLGICLTVFWPIPGVNFKLETSSFHQLSSFCYMRRHVIAWIEVQKFCSTLHPYYCRTNILWLRKLSHIMICFITKIILYYT